MLRRSQEGKKCVAHTFWGLDRRINLAKDSLWLGKLLKRKVRGLFQRRGGGGRGGGLSHFVAKQGYPWRGKVVYRDARLFVAKEPSLPRRKVVYGDARLSVTS
jgi:hypothetical protein